MRGFKFIASGPIALFSRPEMKVERESYDCITPSAARAITEAIYWKPQLRWRVRRLHVLKPIRRLAVRRNEVSSKIPTTAVSSAMTKGGPLSMFVENDRQQRAASFLQDVRYGIEVEFDVVGGTDGAGKHAAMFERRLKKGQCFSRPYLGTRECECHVQWVHEIPEGAYAPLSHHDFGMMLHDIDFDDSMTPYFYQAIMRHGVIDVPNLPYQKSVSS